MATNWVRFVAPSARQGVGTEIERDEEDRLGGSKQKTKFDVVCTCLSGGRGGKKKGPDTGGSDEGRARGWGEGGLGHVRLSTTETRLRVVARKSPKKQDKGMPEETVRSGKEGKCCSRVFPLGPRPVETERIVVR